MKELVLGGVNNEYARGCVVVFEPGAMSGGSPQEDPGYRWLDVGPGSEAAYILFPKTDVHEAIRKAGDPVNYFWIHEGDGLTAVTVETQVFYDLDRTLACRDVNLGNDFKNRHEEFRLAGKVRSVPDDAYRKALGEAHPVPARRCVGDPPRVRPWPAQLTAGSSGGPVRGPKPQDQRTLFRPSGGDVRQDGCGPLRSRPDDDPPRRGARPIETDAALCRLEPEVRPALFFEERAGRGPGRVDLELQRIDDPFRYPRRALDHGEYGARAHE